MTDAGYASNAWDLVVQGYPSPLPRGADIRYKELGYTRQSEGGCGMWNDDLDWANDILLATINGTVQRALKDSGLPNAHFLDLTNAYVGNRLCEKEVGLVAPGSAALPTLYSWKDTDAISKSEWVQQIRVASKYSVGPYELQESLHPNYWGQMANQACLKLAWNGGNVRGGSCVRDGRKIYPSNDEDHRVYPEMRLR